METIPFLAMLMSIIVAILMPVLIVGIVFWYKARDKELRFHQDMRIREMDHQRKLKELELEVEKVKARQEPQRVA
jgi:hypothetical protein